MAQNKPNPALMGRNSVNTRGAVGQQKGTKGRDGSWDGVSVVMATKLIAVETFKGINDSFNVVGFLFPVIEQARAVIGERDVHQLSRARTEERVTNGCVSI